MNNGKLIDYVPSYYAELLESSEILSVQDVEVARLNASIDDLLLQFNVSTATWGLREWERICGFVNTETKTMEERRSNVLARLRGSGVITAAVVRAVAGSYVGGNVIVREVPAEYTIIIEFIDILGIPSNIEDLQRILREIIPAHLHIEYKFRLSLYEKYVGIPYSDFTQLTYQELLAEDVFYTGELNSRLAANRNSELEARTNANLMGGFVFG